MKTRSRQQGYALLIFVAVLAIAAAAVTVKALNNNNGNTQIARDKITAAALAQAKDALIGYASTYRDANPHVPFFMDGYLPNPDLGPGESQEGRAAGNFSGNHPDYSVIGKVPWRKLGVIPLHDGQGECLWYVVSGRFKNTPLTDTLNWDTQGQIDVNDSNGNLIASNVAALLVAPGSPLAGQNRARPDPTDTQYIQCGGNYDARNYLNSYFTGSTNNRVALNTSNKPFIMTNNERFLFVTVDDIFRPIIHRSDFREQISALLDDPYLLTVASSASKKGTNNVECDHTSAANQTFCTNWKEMLLLTQLSTPATITIDGVTSPVCNRVLIFGGQKTTGQARITNDDKNNPDNYLEVPNRAAFDTPTAHSNSFNGASTFSASNPSADLLRCIP